MFPKEVAEKYTLLIQSTHFYIRLSVKDLKGFMSVFMEVMKITFMVISNFMVLLGSIKKIQT